MRTQDTCRGCMLGLAIGDALGATTEFINNREDINAVTGGGVKDLPQPAIYTDDTQMTICVAEALLDSPDPVEKFMLALSKQFIDWYQVQETEQEQRRAPGSTCLTACAHLKSGIRWEESGVPGSTGCGSAMRSAPIGLRFKRLERVVDFAIHSSIITHPNELALSASVGNALVTFLAINDVPTGQWANELIKVASINKQFMELMAMAAEAAAIGVEPDFALSDECLGLGWTGHEAIASALYCCMTNPSSYKDAVLMAANTIGDSDSIACIVGGWMGAKLGLQGIPTEWVDKIENKDKLIDLADRLYSAGETISRPV